MEIEIETLRNKEVKMRCSHIEIFCQFQKETMIMRETLFDMFSS